MSLVLVSPLSQVAAALALRPSHMVSLVSPAGELPEARSILSECRLVLRFNDIVAAQPGFIAPDHDTIETLIAFGRDWVGQAPLLVHCWAGISRSPAAAYIIACAHGVAGDEQRLADRLRAAAPCATPNALMVALADTMLQRGGAMIRAIERIGRGAEASEGEMFRIELEKQ